MIEYLCQILFENIIGMLFSLILITLIYIYKQRKSIKILKDYIQEFYNNAYEYYDYLNNVHDNNDNFWIFIPRIEDNNIIIPNINFGNLIEVYYQYRSSWFNFNNTIQKQIKIAEEIIYLFSETRFIIWFNANIGSEYEIEYPKDFIDELYSKINQMDKLLNQKSKNNK